MISCIIVSAKLPIYAPSMLRLNHSFRAVVLSSLLAAALLFSPVFAFADFRPDLSFVADSNEVQDYLDLASGAAIDGALGALGVKLSLGTGALLTTKDLIDSVINRNPLGVVGYEYQGKFYDLADQSTIRIRDDVVTIDGVEYKDIWLPHDAAVKFRVNAFDFISYYNIISQSSGTYLSGSGTYDGVPLFSDGTSNYLRSQIYSLDGIGNFSVGNTVFTTAWNRQNVDYFVTCTVSSGYSSRSSQSIWQASPSCSVQFRYSVGDSGATVEISNPYAPNISLSNTSSLFDNIPFDFDWVSSTIPAEQLPDEQGLRFRVPSSYVSGLPSVISPDLSQYSAFLQAISDAIEQARLANVVESTAFEEYDAPAPPVPSTGTIAEEPYSSLDGTLSGIQDTLDNVDTNIGTVDESLDDIKIYSRDASESLQSIDTNLSQSVADTAGIKGFVQQYLPGVHSLLSGISSSVSNIAGSIAAADQTFFGNVVDAILVPFTPIINVFKAGMGIWRYVVAWAGNISAPFTWSLSALSGAGSIFLSPIYAAAAAAVVLAVYKKFGR